MARTAMGLLFALRHNKQPSMNHHHHLDSMHPIMEEPQQQGNTFPGCRKRKCGARVMVLHDDDEDDCVQQEKATPRRNRHGKETKLDSQALSVDRLQYLLNKTTNEIFGSKSTTPSSPGQATTSPTTNPTFLTEIDMSSSSSTQEKRRRSTHCCSIGERLKKNPLFLALLLAWGIPGSSVLAQQAAPPEDNVSAYPTTFFPTFSPPTFSPTPRPTWSPTPRPTWSPTPRPTWRPTPRPTFGPTGSSLSCSPSGLLCPGGTGYAICVDVGGGNTVTSCAPDPASVPGLYCGCCDNDVRSWCGPSKAPTNQPTLRPTPLPTNTPTVAPSRKPTNIPTVNPTNRPTWRPSFMPLAPGETRAPTTDTPSLEPTVEMATPYTAEEATQSPSGIVWEEFVVVDAVRVFLELPANQRASPVGLANIWQDYIESTLRLVYNNEDDVVRVKNVLVLVDGQGASPKNGNNRWLQQGNQGQQDVIVQSFQVDTIVDLEKNANHASGGSNLNGQVEGLIGNLLTAKNLQESLDDASVEGVRVAGVAAAEPNRGRGASASSSKEKPEKVELIIGFALIGIMLAMLAITVHSRVKALRKRRKRRRLAKLRQQNSYVMPRQERPLPPSSPAKSKDADVFIEDDDESVDDIIGTYMIDEENYPSNLPTAGTSDEGSDPFANELKQAAVMDDEAWKRLQAKKEELRKRGRVVDSMYSTAAGSGEEGVEIGAATFAAENFPYGVDKNSVSDRSVGATSPSTPVRPPVQSPAKQQLSPDDAVNWATAGLTLNIVGRGSSQSVESPRRFEPYGETKKEPSLQESWDLDEAPKEYYGQYSFMNPLRPRSNDTTNARASPTEFSEDPSAVAVRASLSVSSWSEVDGTDMRASPTESMIPLGMIREQSSDSRSDQGDDTKDESYGTMDMMEEVQRLSAYVRNYEKKKTIKNSLGASTAGESSVSYDAMSDSVSAKRKSGRNASPPSRLTKTSYRQAAAMNNTTSMESSGFGLLESSSDLSGVSESDDEASTRLGISRFSIQNPADSRLMYSVEELPLPALTSREEEDDEAMLFPASPGRGLSIEDSHDISGPMAPDRPRSPMLDLPEDEKMGDLGGPRQRGGKLDEKVSRGKLSKLRGTGNMLDGEEKSEHTAPSDEFTREERRDTAVRRASPPRVRNANRGFANIISMFESKPAKPLTPPNENWQHGINSTPKK